MTRSLYSLSCFRKPAESTNSHDPILARWQQLLSMMEREQLYLDTQLTQQQIADRLEVSCRTLSRLISQYTKQNFNGFINAYRLGEARRLLSNPTSQRLSVEQIATRAGFNSRGVFYRAFKEESGISPARYRDAALSKGEGRTPLENLGGPILLGC